MEYNLKSKIVGLSALALVGGMMPAVSGCNNPARTSNQFFTVKNNLGLEVEFCDVGASIYSIKLNDTYLTYHPKDKNTFIDKDATPYYYGKTLGRVAGRFQDGKFELDGQEYNVQVNEKGKTKNNCLHGGNDAFSFKNFKRYIITAAEKTRVAFNYLSPYGEAGFPEMVDAWVIYTIYNMQNRIDTQLYAVPSGKTVINMSTHSLFRLGNSGDVLNYVLTIPTSTRAKYQNEATKNTDQVVVDVKDVVTYDHGYFDFREGKTIGKDIENVAELDPVSGGYDHIWVYGDSVALADRYVNLYNPENKINFKVTALSDKVTGFILYSNDYPRAGQIMQGDDKEDTKYAGITIEPYTVFFKDDIRDITYTPDKPYYSSYSYEFEQKE